MELLDKVRGAEYFSKLDIRGAFNQVELEENTRSITIFSTDFSLFRYKRLVFGLNCAPEIFQGILENVLRDIEGVINSADDILIFGKDLDDHNQKLKKVHDRLLGKGLTLNKNKCIFAVKEIEFLGFIVNGSDYRLMRSKVETVRNFREPETSEEVRSFLGLVNFCAAFIPNIATISESLRSLTRKSEPFVWSEAQRIAFQTLKEKLIESETLGIYNPDARTRVVADASPVGIGCVLAQEQKQQWRVISYASWSLTDYERKYSQTEKEALALVYACKRFKYWLFGIEFELVTDHKALECIFAPRSKPCSRIERWVLRLQTFKYRVIYESGKSNIADPLSRLFKANNNEGEKSRCEDELFIAYELRRKAYPEQCLSKR